MKKCLYFAFLIFFASCQYTRPNPFKAPPKGEITKIIQAVIYQDSLPVFVKRRSLDTLETKIGNSNRAKPMSFPLSMNLRKLELIVLDTTKKIPEPINLNAVSVLSILGKLVPLKHAPDGKAIVPKDEYEYLLFQNTLPNDYIIGNHFTDQLILTTSTSQMQKHRQGIHVAFYDLTVPILSKNGNMAYVEVTFNCSGMCGGATALYLEKKALTWRIVSWKRLWIS